MTCDAGRGGGKGVVACVSAAGTVCGGVDRAGDLGGGGGQTVGDLLHLAARRLVGGVEAHLERRDFLRQMRDRLLHRLALFEAGGIGRRLRAASPAFVPIAPAAAPTSAANTTEAASSALRFCRKVNLKFGIVIFGMLMVGMLKVGMTKPGFGADLRSASAADAGIASTTGAASALLSGSAGEIDGDSILGSSAFGDDDAAASLVSSGLRLAIGLPDWLFTNR